LKDQIGYEFNDIALEMLTEFSKTLNETKTANMSLKESVSEGLLIDDFPSKAKYFADNVVDKIEELRQVIDQLESITSDDLWPLPKYSEMLFIL